MEQTLPLSEMSTMPTRKLRVMRWVTFVLVLIFSLGPEFIFAIINNSIEVDETRILVRTSVNYAALFVRIAFWLFLIFLSSNRAVRNAMTVFVATCCLSFVNFFFPFGFGWIVFIQIIFCLLDIYAFSIVIMNTNLLSIKKGWITVLCLVYIGSFVSMVTNLFICYPNLQEILGNPDIYNHKYMSFLYFNNPMYNVLEWGETIFFVIAWYQIIFGDAFAYTGFKKDDDGVVYRYSFFNRYTVGMFISSAFVISLMCLLIAKGFTL